MAQNAQYPGFPTVNRQSSVTRPTCLIAVNPWRLEPALPRSADATQTRPGEPSSACSPRTTFAGPEAAQTPELALCGDAAARLGCDLRRGVLVAFRLRPARYDQAPGQGRLA